MCWLSLGIITNTHTKCRSVTVGLGGEGIGRGRKEEEEEEEEEEEGWHVEQSTLRVKVISIIIIMNKSNNTTNRFTYSLR